MLRRVTNDRVSASKTEVWPAPSKGWVQSGNIVTAPRDQAEVLDNFVPTAQGARLRGGLLEYADVNAAVKKMFTYKSGSFDTLFAATETAIYNADRVNTAVTWPDNAIGLGFFNTTPGTEGTGWAYNSGGILGFAAYIGTNVNGGVITATTVPVTFQAGLTYGIRIGINNATQGYLTVSLDGTTPVESDPIIITEDTPGTLEVDVFLQANGTENGNILITGFGNFTGNIPSTFGLGLVGQSPQPWAFAEWEGVTSGDWSSTQISTSGGQFTVAVNGSDRAVYWDNAEFNPILDVAVDEISFDALTADFTVGSTLTGGTSGATATIVGISRSEELVGKLKLTGITGTFQDNETITDAVTGSATANGTTSSASTVTITGVDPSTLSQVWLFKERLFFVQKDTTKAWYLPVESIGGAATEIDLGSVFAQGGNLLFGATWSLDSGSGLDDVCLFCSDRGEIAVFEGSNPASAATWGLVGVYQIGQPIDKHGFFPAGGDLAILTVDGIVPVSEALRKDRGALQAIALTYPIEDAWRSAVLNRTPTDSLNVALWQSGTILLVGTTLNTDDGKPISFIANSRTGAWGRVTGWDVQAQAVSGDQLFIGDSNGKIYEADRGGNDNGTAYSGVYVPKFTNSDVLRSANAVALTYRAPDEILMNLGALDDYEVENIDLPTPFSYAETSTWGTGAWGTFVWGNVEAVKTFTEWQAAYADGYALSPYVAVTCNQTTTPLFELLITRMRTESGYAL